ncbi:Inosine-uridine nucleoside N-ribohydrolase [Fodinibius roseus]|uniref:Inosine-uridine nucleoside N-ribohydrolase n=1 Tax=Fodinibius roseus TaxID=1194090 RepID=A0A1M5HJA5_9BACT|nr:nucleoside hydrolase [Fodinibius roseus]SHG16015.1 Inosine-uridine nucleoside N-ribohydrolase [Fodinibius roseus]
MNLEKNDPRVGGIIRTWGGKGGWESWMACTLLLFSLYGCSSNANNNQLYGDNDQMEQKHRVLFDTDTNNEIDDQHALAYLLFNADLFTVEGITVNSTKEPDVALDYVEAERILKLCKSFQKVPLKKGANGTFGEIQDQVNNSDFDGASAVNFIIEEALAEKEHELILLAVGKLTNIALALKKEPAVASNARLVWLGSNYPEPGEHNQNADTTALNYLLNSDIPFEMVTVRYGKSSGTSAVRVTKDQIIHRMPGKGPHIEEPVEGRHGGLFDNFGDYSVSLFENYTMGGDPPSRPLFDMAAVAIVKHPDWADSKEIPAPVLIDNEWVKRPDNKRTITLWENFHIYGIMNDFFNTMDDPVIESESN